MHSYFRHGATQCLDAMKMQKASSIWIWIDVFHFFSYNIIYYFQVSSVKENHLEMSVDKTFSSLKTVNVDVSDSGIFYCGYVLTNHMMFHDTTQSVVVNGNILRFHLMFISFIYSSIIYIQYCCYSLTTNYFVFFFYLRRD